MSGTNAVLIILAVSLSLMLLSVFFRLRTAVKEKRKKKRNRSVRNDWTDIPDPGNIEPSGILIGSRHTIGVAGTGPRTGTTTQALQLYLYLYYSRTDGKIAYVEMNRTGFLDALALTYRDVKSFPDGRMEYGCLTLVRQRDISTVLTPEYRYLVYDCGAVTDPDFQPGTFLDKNVRVLTAGSKPQELLELTAALGTGMFDDCSILFAHVPEEDEEALSRSLGHYAGQTWFAACQTDPFVSNPHMDVIYRSFLPDEGEEWQTPLN